MDRIYTALEELKFINERYEISNDSIAQLKQNALAAKVCVPVIGKFSSGKSALINTLLGYSRRYKILREDITPETAIPAEITYSEAEEGVVIVRNDDTIQPLSVAQYRDFEADANTVKCARIQLKNDFLEKVPDVVIVDMPGFESGFDVHDKAIDNYLPQSLAYIITFPADDLIVRDSVGNILKELCLHEMPLCVVITKYDKRNDDFDAALQHLKESLVNYVGNRDIIWCMTSSFTGDANELEIFLRHIQEESQEILFRSFRNSVLAFADKTEGYLKKVQSDSGLSESELDEEEEKLEKQSAALGQDFDRKKSEFESEMMECVTEIRDDVSYALENVEDTLVAMLMNSHGSSQDSRNVQERLNLTVRNAVTVSVRKRMIPKMKKYISTVSEDFNSGEMGDICLAMDVDTKSLEKSASDYVAAAAAAVLGGLVGGLLVGLVALIAAIGIGGKSRERKREEKKQQIRDKLENEVFPQVLNEVEKSMKMEVAKQTNLVNAAIEKEIQSQKEIMKKALTDVRSRMEAEQADKEKRAKDIGADLQKIGEIRNGLQ